MFVIAGLGEPSESQAVTRSDCSDASLFGTLDCVDPIVKPHTYAWCGHNVCMGHGPSSGWPFFSYGEAKADAELTITWWYEQNPGLCEPLQFTSEDADFHGHLPDHPNAWCLPYDEPPITCGVRSAYWDVVAGSPSTSCIANNIAQEITRTTEIVCPAGYAAKDIASEDGFCYRTPALACPAVGNPTSIADGNKIQPERDFTDPNGGMLTFTRTYNHMASRPVRLGANGQEIGGGTWFHSFEIFVETSSFTDIVVVHRADGSRHRFYWNGTAYQANSDDRFSLEKSLDSGGNPVGWVYRGRDDQIETFDLDGNLTKISWPSEDLFVNHDTVNDVLHGPNTNRTKITRASGRNLTILYNADGRLGSMIQPNGERTDYLYLDYKNLTFVEYPDGSVRRYHYEYNDSPSNNVNALTGVTDENGDRYSRFDYYSAGNASPNHNSQVRWTENGNGVNRHSFAYGSNPHESLTTYVTDPLGVVRKYDFVLAAGVRKIASVDEPCSDCGSGGAQFTTYDQNGFRDLVTDFDGVVTDFDYDSRGLMVSETEAAGTAEARTTTTVWHSVFRKPLSITRQNSQSNYAYNSRGQITSRTEQDTLTGSTRNWAYSYCEQSDIASGYCPVLGRLLEMDGPRTDVSDITTYTYYNFIGVNHLPGDIQRVTDGIGNTTEYLAYDGNGRPLQIRDSNGVDQFLSYDLRGRLVNVTTNAHSTVLDYDAAGQLIRTTQPSGSYVEYEYDTAHRLVEIRDNFGNAIEYTLDNAGNRTLESTKDASGALRQQLSRIHNDLSQTLRLIDGVGNPTDFEPSVTGNNLSTTDGNGNQTQYSYDALDRLLRVTQPSTQSTGSSGLVAGYSFEGTLADGTGNNPDGQIIKGGVSYPNGIAGSAVKLDSVRTKLDLGELNGFEGLNEYTVSFWFQLNNYSAQFGTGKSNMGALGEFAFWCVTGYCKFFIDNKVSPSGFYFQSQAGVWNHWVAVYSNDELKVYLDGTLVASKSRSHTTAIDDKHWTIGESHNNRYGARDSMFDELRIYDRALSAAEVSDLFSNPTTMSGAAGTNYTYDERDNLTSVSDPRGLVTTYTYDGLDNLTQLDSPDTGITTYTYDNAGNRISMTDARSVTVNYTYDALNRLTFIDYAGTSLDITYTYDQGTYGKGRLTAMTDATGSTNYTYNALGQLTSETQIIDGHTFTLGYTYDGAGNLLTMTYPSGQVVTYTRDAAARISAISRFDGTTDTLASNISYLPFGPMNAMTLGNGIQVTRDYDLAYRVTDIDQGVAMDRSYGYDANSNITGITDHLNATKNQSFGYDALNRLDSATGVYGSESYAYDPVGNRTQSVINSVTSTYGYASNSNRLASVDSDTYSYDAVGNITNDGNRQFVYDDRNRMVGSDQGVTDLGDYDYNGRGERVKKTASGVTTYFIYSNDGMLIAEADGTGAIVREYLYQDGQRLAVSEGSNLYYFHIDHLGTPQGMTDETGAVVWSVDFTPFGGVHVQSGAQGSELRFPGQYFDGETGLSYNYFRDYDSGIGRYVQSDPIGLQGGVNTFGYAFGNPVLLFDPLGLAVQGFWEEAPHIRGIDVSRPRFNGISDWAISLTFHTEGDIRYRIRCEKDECPEDEIWYIDKAHSFETDVNVNIPLSGDEKFLAFCGTSKKFKRAKILCKVLVASIKLGTAAGEARQEAFNYYDWLTKLMHQNIDPTVICQLDPRSSC